MVYLLLKKVVTLTLYVETVVNQLSLMAKYVTGFRLVNIRDYYRAASWKLKEMVDEVWPNVSQPMSHETFFFILKQVSSMIFFTFASLF